MEKGRDSSRLHLRFNPKNSDHMKVYDFLNSKKNKVKVITMALLEFMDNHPDEDVEKMIKKFKNKTINNPEHVTHATKKTETFREKETLNENFVNTKEPPQISDKNLESKIIKSEVKENDSIEKTENFELSQDDENDLLDSLDMFE